MPKTYGYGYGSNRYDANAIHQVEGFRQVHPELRRRLLSMIDDYPNDDLRIGQGWRSIDDQKQLFTQRYYRVNTTTKKFWDGSYWQKRPGVAEAGTPGNSSHGGFKSDNPPCFAVDLVNVNPAISWVLANCSRYGLKHFLNVNGEAWHIQPIELPNSRGEIEKSLDKFTQWKLSDGGVVPIIDKPIKPSVPVPGGDPEIFLNAPDASRNRWLQRLLNDCGFADPKLEESGVFGADSVEALKRLQRKIGLKDDGRYGSSTASATLAWLST